MTIEFIGLVHTAPGSEGVPGSGPVIQPGYLRELAQAHESSGFDRVLVAHSSASPDAFTVASQVLNATDRLGVLLAHRPGFLAPTIAARNFATIDAFHPGRIALHVISGGDDADQARDGDLSDKPTRYRRTDEFLDIVRQEWTSQVPFDYDGEFYQVRGAWSAVRPPAGRVPIFFGGASGDAIRVGGKHADVYAFWGEPIAGIVERIREVTESAAAPNRTGAGPAPRFSVSLRPITAETEQAAWDRAQDILEVTKDRLSEVKKVFKFDSSGAEGSRRLLDAAARSDVHDKRLWTAVAKATGAPGNTTALVGTPEQVADSLVDYVDVGVSTLLIRGFDPLPDAVAYAELIQLVRERTADRTLVATGQVSS
jgi:alkanesulfonate monooxygenase